VPTFPNARYLFSRRDFEHFGQQQSEDDHFRAFRDSVLPVYEAGRAELIEPDIEVHREISERLWLEPAFGHSPGNFSVLAEGAGQRAIFWGDVIHHPVQLIRPEVTPSFDGDPAKARETRLRTLARAADEELVCFPAHCAPATCIAIAFWTDVTWGSGPRPSRSARYRPAGDGKTR
jgi:glyoxylase-like metal-dependent hydrolase (beta-lactamase superfamily II)